MKKNQLLRSMLLVLLVLLTAFNLSFAEVEDDEEQGNFPPPDPNYGTIYRNQIISNIMTNIDSTTSSGELSPATSFFIKRRINEISEVINPAGDRAPVLKASSKHYDISAQLGELNTVFDVTRASESPKLEILKKDIDKLAATTGSFDSCNSLSNEALKEKLHDLVGNHRSLGYNGIRQAMFSDVDNEGGKVRCVYTARQVSCNSTPSANPPQAMNTEHTWPKSLGAGSEPAKSDINHLYPTDTFANSTRSSYPFGNVTNPKWAQGGSSFDGDTFMPREDHRGKVARAYFYFSVRYNLQIKDAEEKVLREWHAKYPVTQEEKDRNEKVCGYQGNRNPFVDRPDFVDKIKNF
ncbi:MAG: Extracellular ribonuclease precursor [bacterium ADurb.Bin243]|nr:MAG: Extracellular ribonuclease precursor [bacterium ADurb.Bin243]HOD42787.1 endonuclease [Candidatus Wallbacteria bacterium]